jgi:Holliday junction resolvase RusA-like endonuclease
MYTPTKSRNFKFQLAELIAKAVGRIDPISEPVILCIEVMLDRPKSARKRLLPSVKPDLDNLEKSVMDACTEAGIWTDDALVTTKHSCKRYADERGAGIRIAVWAESADR